MSRLTEIFQTKGDVTYDDVSFAYPTRPDMQVLNSLDLSVHRGKTVALVGPSGCGKSTVVQLLQRFYDPSSGRVTIDGNNLKSFKIMGLRSNIGIVSQEPNLFDRTIKENIAYGDNNRLVSENDVITAAKDANIHNFVTSLPLVSSSSVVFFSIFYGKYRVRHGYLLIWKAI